MSIQAGMCEICGEQKHEKVCPNCTGKFCNSCTNSCTTCPTLVCSCCAEGDLVCKDCQKYSVQNIGLNMATDHETCQACGITVPLNRRRQACRHCTISLDIVRRTSIMCMACAVPLYRCDDCFGYNCKVHEQPRNHVRYGTRNVLDTCGKRTACLKRLIVDRKSDKIYVT